MRVSTQNDMKAEKNMFITDDIKYIGVNDKDIDLFEGQYSVPRGMSYNSYVIIDERIAVLDTVDKRFADEWLAKLSDVLSGRAPDYLIVQHMEPDHSANIAAFLEKYPEATVVASAKAFAMMKGFFGADFAPKSSVVGEGSRLSLGSHELTFVAAPMVHWPEVIVTYDKKDKVLFSADGFGKFGALDADEPWDDEARRYYIGIVGKYGAQVQALLKKAAALDVGMICPLHGPVLSEDLGHYISLYDTWSSYRPETEGTVIAYASIYGNTAKAALALADMLKERGERVEVYDLARCDIAEATAAAFRYSKLVLASVTYNAGVFPFMREYLAHLTERGYRDRTIALIENGSWAPMAAKVMRGELEGLKNISFAECAVKITSAPDAACEAALSALADELSGRA